MLKKLSQISFLLAIVGFNSMVVERASACSCYCLSADGETYIGEAYHPVGCHNNCLSEGYWGRSKCD